jgi:predicted enzyme related to lactoylglutathione lyase
MSLRLGNITFDCADTMRVASFWSAVLGRPLDEDAADGFASIGRGDDGNRPAWLFNRVPEVKAVKNRVHVDLSADDPSVEVDRIVGLGAARLAEHDEGGVAWTVLADPEGNEFCVG